MKRTHWIGLMAVCASLSAWAQQGARVIQVPFGGGVYYQGSAGWINLPMTVLVPEKERGAKYWFGTGTSNLHADLPGLHSGVAVANARPTFYMRGYRPGTELRLVRETAQTDYRRVKMSGSLDSKVWGQFRPEDVTEVEIESIAQGVVTVKPRTDLKPGEYVVVSSVDRGFRALRMAYEFGVATPANR